jgi:DNA processing protein
VIGVGALGPTAPLTGAGAVRPGQTRVAEGWPLAESLSMAGFVHKAPTPNASLGGTLPDGAPSDGAMQALAQPPGLEEERLAWVVLATVDGLGERTLRRLLLTHGNARRVLELAAAGRLGRELRAEEDGEAGQRPRALLARTHAGILAAAADLPGRLSTLSQMRLWALTLIDPDYPGRLRRIADPPAVLFGRGDPALLHHPATVAIVGTRRPTPGGRVLAARLARGLAVAGVAVVSGLAIGIDGAAHAATAEAGRPTLAVIGSGHARPGPRAHRALLERILASGGAVVGELPPAAHATRGTYPRRNRLISALADAVVVVEAPERSGALITAHHALEQGVPLYVHDGRHACVRGGGGGAPWAGCRLLLAESSAQPFSTAEELMARLLHRAAGSAGSDGGADPAVAEGPEVLPALGGLERRVACILARGPASTDLLAAETGLAPGVVSGLLTMLQLRGLAAPLGPLNLPAGPLLSATGGLLGSASPAGGARRG